MNNNSENKEIITKNIEIDENDSIFNLDRSNQNSNMKEENKNINCSENSNEKEIINLENNISQSQFQINSKEKEPNINGNEEPKVEKEKTEYTKKIGNYILFDQIGMGTFSKVTKAIHLITSQQVAVKILDKEKIEDEIDLERIIREIEILKNIHHPNIAQMYETYSTIHNFYLMMELVSGGDLFDFISENSCLSENLSCHFFRQLISVLDYLISMGITHRDIKPENILLDEKHQNIKVIDFGLSNYCEDDELLGSSCGSPCYASPEMLSGNPYRGVKTDIWSAGVVLYSMLVGSLPFDDHELYNLYEQIKTGKFYLPSTLSLEAIDLLKRILQVDPKKRIGIDDIKKHPWFNIEKNPMYKGINISKEKFPCNKDVVKFILDNYFYDEKEINFDMVVDMVEMHACNKYTSTYYLTKYNILEIDDECSIIDDDYTEDKNEGNNDNNINALINNINLGNHNNHNLNIIKEKTDNVVKKERKLLKSKTRGYIDNTYNKIKDKLFGLLHDEENNINYIDNFNKLNQNEINKNIEQEKEKERINSMNKRQKEENQNKIKFEEYNKKENKRYDNNIKNDDIFEKQELNITAMQNEISKNKAKIGIINKREKIINKRNNNNKILFISNTDRDKFNLVNELKEDSYFKNLNKNKLNFNTVNNKDTFNLFKINNIKDKKPKTKSINTSYNKSSLNDKIINNNNKIKYLSRDKSISSNNRKTSINKNSNLSEGYEKKQISYIRKNNISSRISEKKNLAQVKTPPKENTGHFNFYVINNIINKEKDFEDKKFSSINCDNKAILRGFTEFNRIKTLTNNKKVTNIVRNKSKDNNNNFLSKIMKKKLAEKNIKKHSKLKTEQIPTLSLKTQLKFRNQIKMKDDLNKIKVNLKSNNSYLINKNKSPSKTIMTEMNPYKKDLKKVFPKLKLEGINNKIKNTINARNNEYNHDTYHKIISKNNYLFYTQNNINSNNITNNYCIDHKNNLTNDRSDSLSNNNINKTNKIYKRKVKNNCIISKNKICNINNKNNLSQTKNNNSLNEESKILSHQRFLTSALKSKLKTENNTLVNLNKLSNIIKDNIHINKKNKVLKSTNFSIQNNSYMNEYYSSQNPKNRKSLTKGEDEAFLYKSIRTDNNSANKTNNKKIVKRTSYLGITTRFNINNSDIIWMKNNNKSHISNKNSIHSKISKQIKKEHYLINNNNNNNNQNVININMVMKNKNKYKNRNYNSYLQSNESNTSTQVIYNTENNNFLNQSPYFTEKCFDNHNNNNNSDKNSYNCSALKKNERRKNMNIF